MHNRPTISPTMLLQNMYQNPVINAPLGPDGYPIKVDERKAQQEFEVSFFTCLLSGCSSG
jgi:splicing factor U2AF 35 kDa subunit